jgi:hypothetical protein
VRPEVAVAAAAPQGVEHLDPDRAAERRLEDRLVRRARALAVQALLPFLPGARIRPLVRLCLWSAWVGRVEST